jgi:hypothetical protein
MGSRLPQIRQLLGTRERNSFGAIPCHERRAQQHRSPYLLLDVRGNLFGLESANFQWGVLSPWNWAQSVGNSWRTTIDIGDYWDSMIRVLDNNIGLSPFAGPGGNNK